MPKSILTDIAAVGITLITFPPLFIALITEKAPDDIDAIPIVMDGPIIIAIGMLFCASFAGGISTLNLSVDISLLNLGAL